MKRIRLLLAMMLTAFVMSIGISVSVASPETIPIWIEDQPQADVPMLLNNDADSYVPQKVPLQNTSAHRGIPLVYHPQASVPALYVTDDVVAPTQDVVVPNPGEIVNDIKDSKSWTDLLGVEAAVFSFLIILGGWITPWVPGLKNIDSGIYRILTWAILVIAGGVVIGFGNVWQGAIAYFFSTSLYDVVLKLLVKSPKPKPQ